MQTNHRRQIGTRTLYLIGLVIGLMALAACQPIRDPAVIAAQATAVANGTPAAALGDTATATDDAAEDTSDNAEATSDEAEVADATTDATDEGPEVAPATATITADSLRVRAEPNDDAEVVTGARTGETYDVIGISSDGVWVQLEIPRSPSGTGWVSASFVTLEGDITNIATIEVEGSESATTDDAAEEATPEATAEADEAVTEEPTAEATPEPTEEATDEATEETTDEATDETADEAGEGASTEDTSEEATDEAVDAGLGTVTIVTDLPLRVRSDPTTEVENKVGNVFDGEVYTVLEVTEDGLWVRIDVPELDLENGGWVSAEYVVFNEAE